MIGTVLGNRYELVEKIGTGGMAEVYKAKCRLLNRYVAVKILKQEYINDEEFLARFKTESQAAASLSHHNIVSIYDVGRDGDCNYIVMEFVEGITLKEYIDKNGIFSWREAIDISVQILDALEHAHKHEIVHRDIKPHNIMITPDKSIKVMDFGIARAATASTLTLSGTTIGSVHYFSPEQAKGSYTDAKSDIYSMGIVMYEMLTGRVPFDGDSPISIAIMQIQNNPPSLKEYNISVPLALESVVMKAMSKDRDTRYQTAAAMANDLKLIEKLPEIAVKKEELPKEEPVSGGTKVMPVVKDTDIDDYLSKHRDDPVKEQKKEPENKQPKKKLDTATIAGYAAAGVLAAVVIFFLSLLLGGTGEQKVPNLIGMTFEEACDEYESGEVTIIKAGEEASDKYGEGIIVSQDPKKGEGYKSEVIISVVISSGKGEIVLDDYAGMSIEETIDAINKLGLEYEEVSVDDDEVEPGKVIKTKPAAGKSVNKDQIIIIYVSSTEDTVAVPNLMGKSLDEAKDLIEEAGLKLGTVSEMESDKKENSVIQQVPSAGETVEKDASVDLLVAKKPEGTISKTITVTIPQDKDTTQIRVVVNGKTAFNEAVSKKAIAKDVLVEGIAPLTVDIYHDGALVSSQRYE